MEFPVLKYLDVLIGLSLVMLLVSTVVLAVTQVLLNSTFARARHLQRGLRRLIINIDPQALRAHAPYIAALVVRHPLVGQQTGLTFYRHWRNTRRQEEDAQALAQNTPGEGAELLPPLSPGQVIQREELAYMLVEFAAGEGPLMDPLDTGTAPRRIAAVQAALARSLRLVGIEDPAATLRAIRIRALENERGQPDAPAAKWRADAVIDCAKSDFVGKLHAGFDATMARVIDGFTWEGKAWASAVALVVAVALQLDSFALIRRLSVDDASREAFLQVASTFSTPPPGETPIDKAARDKAVQDARESLALLGSPKIDLLPRVGRDAPLGNYFPDAPNVPGVLFSWLLLSLGAPFWYDALKNLLRLRSVMAKKDEIDRAQRERADAAPAAAPPRPPVPAAGNDHNDDEAGDLAATGATG